MLDVANLVASGKYSTGMPASWPEGDFNDDGVMDILDISDFVSTGPYNTGSYTGGEVIAPVRPWSPPSPRGPSLAPSCQAAMGTPRVPMAAEPGSAGPGRRLFPCTRTR